MTFFLSWLRCFTNAIVCSFQSRLRPSAVIFSPVLFLIVSPSYAQLPLTNIVQVSTGSSHTCAVTSSGALKCWGSNTSTQLGDQSAGSTPSLAAISSTLDSNVRAVAAGSSHTCALTTSNTVKCWGDNYYGQIGNDSTIPVRPAPDDVHLYESVRAIDAGSGHTCALTYAGGVKCWGDNTWGQLGNTRFNRSAVPVDVYGLSSGVSGIAVGYEHSCAILSSGGVRCWGKNNYGQLGNGTTDDSVYPMQVSGLTSGVVKLSASFANTCALLNTGAAKCWGSNYFGEVGDNTNIIRKTPVDVIWAASGVIDIAATNAGTCALFDTGRVKCWGNNGTGQLGNNSTVHSMTPVDVVGLENVTSLDMASGRACAVAAGEVKCWGDNPYGQLGNNTTTRSLIPVNTLLAVVPAAPTNVVAVAGNGRATITLTAPAHGGSPLSSYRIVSTPAAIDRFVTTSTQTHVITGLTNGVDYTFTVSAKNVVGESEPSLPSNIVTPGIPLSSSSLSSSSLFATSSSLALTSSSIAESSSVAASSFSSSDITSSSASSVSSVVTSTSSSSSTAAGGCVAPVSVTLGFVYYGALATTDCTNGSRGSQYYTDRYTFSGVSGQQIAIQLSSSTFDTYLYLKNASGGVLSSNDDGGGGSNSRIPASSGYFTLPATGTYTIEVSSYSGSTTGAYTLSLSVSTAVSSSSSSVSTCYGNLSALNATNYGQLAVTDCTNGARGAGYYTDRHSFVASPGTQVAIQLTSSAFDTFVYLKNPAGTVIASNDDGGGGTNSRIPAGSGYFTIPAGASGTYIIEVTSYGQNATGNYTLLLTQP